MITFACEAIHPGCEATFRARGAVEVLPLLTMHAWRAHDLRMPHLPATVVRLVLRSCQPVPVTPVVELPAPRAELPVAESTAPVVLPAARLLDVAGLEVAGQPARG